MLVVRVLAAVVLLTVARAGSAADAVLDWNAALLDAVRDTRTPPPQATRAFAMTHLAMFDAVNGIAQEYEPYLVDFEAIAPPEGASAEAAAAAAAHTVLVSLYPDRSKRFGAELNRSLGKVRSKESERKGVEWGVFCGEAMLALRADDGANATVPYTPTDECGRWQPTPPNFNGPLFAQWAHLTPFAMLAVDQFRPGPPPTCDSFEYAMAFLHVQALGADDSTLRTKDETEIAFFWEDGAGSLTPPGHWQLIAQDLAERFDQSLLENARMFALLSLTQADAAIASWDAKYAYDHWRPITGIGLADLDENDLTEADLDWRPLIPTPAFPGYTSGHSTFSGGSAELLELFLDDRNLEITIRTPQPSLWPNRIGGAKRSYGSLREAAEEAGISRIYGGIHWQYDNIVGLESGRSLAQFVFASYLRPFQD